MARCAAGAIPVVVSDLYKPRELLYFIADTGARVLFIDAEQLPKLAEIAAELPASLKTIVVRGERSDRCARFPRQSVMTLAAALAAEAPPGDAYRRHSNELAYMFYSGGTTGTAKGITHLAYDFLLVPARHGAMWEYTARDVVYATSKKYFTHGIWPGLLIPLAFGATLVLDRRPPTADVVLENLRRHNVTKFVTVPTVLKNLIELVKKSGEPANCPHLEVHRERVGKDAAGDFRGISPAVRRRAAQLDRQLRDRLRVDRQHAEGVQARQPRQAGVRLRGRG